MFGISWTEILIVLVVVLLIVLLCYRIKKFIGVARKKGGKVM